MKERSERRRATSYMILAFDVVALIVVLGLVLQALSSHALRQLKRVAEVQQSHWQKVVSHPCVAAQKHPDVPKLPENPGVWDYIVNLKTISNHAEGIWLLYVGCQEPKTETIKEELLHFTVDKYDKFDEPPEPAYLMIYGFVDKYLPLRSEIYISGHTDRTGPDQHNFELSYKRARHVMEKIDAYLAAQGKVRGVDYRIYPLGMGSSQQLQQPAGQSDEVFFRRCRRIDLSFRSRGIVIPEPGYQ